MVDKMEETKKESTTKQTKSYRAIEKEFVAAVLATLDEVQSEIGVRNEEIAELDEYIYGDGIAKTIDVPASHDKTPVNWLKRVVEIHKDQFMGRGFQPISTYNSADINSVNDPAEQKAIILENKKAKEYAEKRQDLIKAIIEDNGGFSMWQELAESASAVGTACVKAYYDEDEKKYEITPIESIENVYAVWSHDNFREYDAISYVYQVSKREAISDYGVPEDVPTSPLGQPLEYNWNVNPLQYTSTQNMVTVLSVTGYISGYAGKNGKIVEVPAGKETEISVKIVGDKIYSLITDEKKLPRYYILPNKRIRRRPWGVSDVTDAAIEINRTYVETLSDWRTVASKVNFPKFKGYGFVAGSEVPKPKPRTVEILPMADGQDIQPLNQGDANQVDFKSQMEELKEQFVRETRISRVFFDDPSITLNSNQALMTSMKPTTDVAEAKKSLWGPILKQIFEDALDTIALYDPTVKEIVEADETASIKIMWPSTMQKEDPVYQQMLLNRFNANTISLASYLEAQGETKEEVDRIREEFENPLTGAILAKQTGGLYQAKLQAGMQQQMAEAGFLDTTQPQQPAGQPSDMRSQVATQGENVPGAGVISQPGSGATAVSPMGALNQNSQQNLGA